MKKHICRIFLYFFMVMLIGTQNSILALDDVDVVEGRIINVTDPIDEQDAANKKYVDDSLDMLPNPPPVLQTLGQSDTATVSQKTITDALSASAIMSRPDMIAAINALIQDAVTEALKNRPTFTDLFPVGSIYMSISPDNPSTYFPNTTWTAWGQGRVPLGMGSNGTTNYTTVQATNNSNAETHTLTTSEMPAHDGHVPNASYAWGEAGESTYVLDKNNGAAFQHATNRPYVVRAGNEMCIRSNPAGNGNAHNNMQPYITCYMWRRTA